MTGHPLIIGHRGASAHAPENSIAALQLAVEAGADGVEFDVRLAKDGVPVVIHDADLRRVAGRREKVADLTSTELAEIDVGCWFGKGSCRTETVPTLEKALELLKGWSGRVYVELKTEVPTRRLLAERACGITRGYLPLSSLIIKSFDLDILTSVRSILPEVEIAALFEPTVNMVFRQRTGLLDIAARCGANHISLHWSLANRRLVSAAHAAQMPVTIWTVDHPRWLARANDLGIRSLITNDPAKLLAARKGAIP